MFKVLKERARRDNILRGANAAKMDVLGKALNDEAARRGIRLNADYHNWLNTWFRFHPPEIPAVRIHSDEIHETTEGTVVRVQQELAERKREEDLLKQQKEVEDLLDYLTRGGHVKPPGEKPKPPPPSAGSKRGRDDDDDDDDDQDGGGDQRTRRATDPMSSAAAATMPYNQPTEAESSAVAQPTTPSIDETAPLPGEAPAGQENAINIQGQSANIPLGNAPEQEGGSAQQFVEEQRELAAELRQVVDSGRLPPIPEGGVPMPDQVANDAARMDIQGGPLGEMEAQVPEEIVQMEEMFANTNRMWTPEELATFNLNIQRDIEAEEMRAQEEDISAEQLALETAERVQDLRESIKLQQEFAQGLQRQLAEMEQQLQEEGRLSQEERERMRQQFASTASEFEMLQENIQNVVELADRREAEAEGLQRSLQENQRTLQETQDTLESREELLLQEGAKVDEQFTIILQLNQEISRLSNLAAETAMTEVERESLVERINELEVLSQTLQREADEQYGQVQLLGKQFEQEREAIQVEREARQAQAERLESDRIAIGDELARRVRQNAFQLEQTEKLVRESTARQQETERLIREKEELISVVGEERLTGESLEKMRRDIEALKAVSIAAAEATRREEERRKTVEAQADAYYDEAIRQIEERRQLSEQQAAQASEQIAAEREMEAQARIEAAEREAQMSLSEQQAEFQDFVEQQQENITSGMDMVLRQAEENDLIRAEAAQLQAQLNQGPGLFRRAAGLMANLGQEAYQRLPELTKVFDVIASLRSRDPEALPFEETEELKREVSILTTRLGQVERAGRGEIAMTSAQMSQLQQQAQALESQLAISQAELAEREQRIADLSAQFESAVQAEAAKARAITDDLRKRLKQALDRQQQQQRAPTTTTQRPTGGPGSLERMLAGQERRFRQQQQQELQELQQQEQRIQQLRQLRNQPRLAPGFRQPQQQQQQQQGLVGRVVERLVLRLRPRQPPREERLQEVLAFSRTGS